MPFLYPPAEMAQVLRTYLLFAPEKLLFGTDPMPAPMVPVGPEVAHLMLCRVLSPELALAIGKGVLRGNAQRLHGWS